MDSNHAAKVNANYRSAFSKLVGHIPEGEVATFGPLTAVSAGIPAPIFNQIFTFDSPTPENLKAAISWMTQRDVPFWVTVPEPLVSDVGGQLAEFDLAETEQVHPGMLMPSLAELSTNETVADITEVTDSDLLDEFIESFVSGFEVPPEHARQANPVSMVNDEDFRLFIGRVDEETVACGLLVRTDDVAGVYSIGVVEGARRQGIGEAMSWEVLRAGRDAGCDIGALQSSEMAYPLYQRMGFETVVNYHHFGPSG
jgi:GNAT superfamily N-acetyltransferase